MAACAGVARASVHHAGPLESALLDVSARSLCPESQIGLQTPPFLEASKPSPIILSAAPTNLGKLLAPQGLPNFLIPRAARSALPCPPKAWSQGCFPGRAWWPWIYNQKQLFFLEVTGPT